MKPSLSDVGDTLELIERWSLFDDDEVRKYLCHMFKKLDKEYLQVKKQKKISDVFIKLQLVLCCIFKHAYKAPYMI